MQEPLRKELINGVVVLKEKVTQFDIDFEINGPMVEGIPAKEASERYDVSRLFNCINLYKYTEKLIYISILRKGSILIKKYFFKNV